MKTVLIVEDSPSMRTTLDVLLRAKRLRTMLAQNAGDALKLIAASPPDLILLDLRMPGMTGLMLLGQLHNHARWKDLPVIVISAQDDEESQNRAHKLGARHYFVKSRYSTAELLHQIRGCFLSAA